MNKEQKFYYKLGQAVCNITGAMLFIAVPVMAIWVADMLSKIILGG